MNLLTRLGKILSRACVYYTAATLLFYTLGNIGVEAGTQRFLSLKMMYLLFLFSVLFETVNHTVLHTRFPYAVKLLMHYGACTLIFSVVFIVWGGTTSTTGGVFVVLVAYTLIYAACAIVLAIIRHIRGTHKNIASPYESQFTNVKK